MRNPYRSLRSAPDRQQGSFLIEAIISLAIFAISIIGLVGLSSQGMNQVGQTRARNEASFLAGELISDIWVSGVTPASYNTASWITRVQNTLPGSAATVTVTGSMVAITITWPDAKNATVAHQYVTAAQIANN